MKPDYFLVLPVAFINEFIKRERNWLKMVENLLFLFQSLK